MFIVRWYGLALGTLKPKQAVEKGKYTILEQQLPETIIMG
jgi:hypothetical protein